MAAKNTPVKVFQSIDMKGGDPNVCWPWTGKLNAKDGRPYFTCDGTRRPAYSWVLELVSGEKPNGRLVRHNCDNELCCNPHHLGYGTHRDNMNDMKDRERHGVPKIVRRAIIKLVEEGRTHQDVADLYGLSREAVTKIMKRHMEAS